MKTALATSQLLVHCCHNHNIGGMKDFFTRTQRSQLMSRIRGRANVSTELKIAGILRAAGIKGWCRHLPRLGRPDFTFPAQRVCIFVHGCFWHDCPRCKKRSRTRPEYWTTKIDVNRKRDQRVFRELRRRDYKVIVHRERTFAQHPEAAISRLLRLLNRSGIKNHRDQEATVAR